MDGLHSCVVPDNVIEPKGFTQEDIRAAQVVDEKVGVVYKIKG